jgi:hypothetical protein
MASASPGCWRRLVGDAVEISAERIADEVSTVIAIDAPTVRRVVERLQRLGWLKIEKPPRFSCRRCRYVPTMPATEEAVS